MAMMVALHYIRITLALDMVLMALVFLRHSLILLGFLIQKLIIGKRPCLIPMMANVMFGMKQLSTG
jgi:hypothetical protein